MEITNRRAKTIDHTHRHAIPLLLFIYIYIYISLYIEICMYLYVWFVYTSFPYRIYLYRYPGDCRWGGMGHTIIDMMHCIDDRHRPFLLYVAYRCLDICFRIESNDIHLSICIGHTTTERHLSLDYPFNVHAPRSRQEHHTTHPVRPWQLAN